MEISPFVIIDLTGFPHQGVNFLKANNTRVIFTSKYWVSARLTAKHLVSGHLIFVVWMNKLECSEYNNILSVTISSFLSSPLALVSCLCSLPYFLSSQILCKSYSSGVKEIQPVHPKGNQSWIFIGRTDAEAEAPILWPPDVKNWLTRKDPDAGKDGRQEEKGMTEDEMVGWHHWLDGHEFVQAPGVGDGQRGLECCGPWDRKELDMTDWTKAFCGYWFTR